MLRIRSSVLGLVLLLCGNSFAQTFTPKYSTTVGIHCNGFYEYLPAGYDPNGSVTYPLLIASHGVGERGDGSTLQLPLLIQSNKGLASLLNTGTFPTSFTVNSQTFRFIILCPQYTDNGTTWPGASDLEDVINYATSHYKVDINRIYLTGLSMGGGVTFNYVTASTVNANKIAAIVTICPALPPGPPYQPKPDSLVCRNITTANLPVYATHNSGDNVVPVSFTDSMVHYINATPPPTPLAKKTIFTTWSDPHDAWTATYDPSFLTQDGINIYQWMLQYQRSMSALPVSLSSYKARVSAPGQVTIDWATTNESGNHHFTLEWSANGTAFTPLASIAAKNAGSTYSYTDLHPSVGNNYYRLSQTDVNGRTTYFSVLKVNLRPAGAGVVSLTPNPVEGNGKLSVSHVENGPVHVRLLTTAGTMIREWSFTKTEYEWKQDLDLSSLPAGIYLVQVSGNAFTETQRLIKK